MSIQPPRFDPKRREAFDVTVGPSERMGEVRRAVEKAAGRTNDLLLVGEPGTGKELLAIAIHKKSSLKGPFLRVDGGASPSGIDNRLFGPKPTGATLYLHEVGELSARTQSQLKEALEARGRGASARHVSPLCGVRLIAASSRELDEAARQGRFDAALLRRLSQECITLPPLRERHEDIPSLIDHFMAVLRTEMGHQVESFSAAALDAIMSRDWPGNIRELYGSVRMTVVLSPARVIEPSDLWPRRTDPSTVEPYSLGYRELRRRVLMRFETDFVSRILAMSDGNVSMAARLAKIDRKHLWRILQRTGVRLERLDE